jgi:hypothetical protein
MIIEEIRDDLKEIKRDIKEINSHITGLKINQAELNIKSSICGAVGGSILAVIGLIANRIYNG